MPDNLYYTQRIRGFQQQSVKHTEKSVIYTLKFVHFAAPPRDEGHCTNVWFTHIVSFWTFRRISNAQMEGFNSKIRHLIRQAYGFRDREYFKLKIFQKPAISCEKTV